MNYLKTKEERFCILYWRRAGLGFMYAEDYAKLDPKMCITGAMEGRNLNYDMF